jgi:hypothetical protein
VVLAGWPVRHTKEPVGGHFLTQRERTREDNAGTGPHKSETLCEERLPLEIDLPIPDALLCWETHINPIVELPRSD